MAFAVKGSRLITVDGTVYRWRLRRRATYNQLRGDTPLTLAVELADSSGCVLTVAVHDVSHPASLFASSSLIVRPALVAAVIGIALPLSDDCRVCRSGCHGRSRVRIASVKPAPIRPSLGACSASPGATCFSRSTLLGLSSS